MLCSVFVFHVLADMALNSKLKRTSSGVEAPSWKTKCFTAL